MTTLKEIEQAIRNLPEEQLARLRDWFYEFDAQAWDSKLEADIESGKLDCLANQALKEHSSGATRKL